MHDNICKKNVYKNTGAEFCRGSHFFQKSVNNHVNTIDNKLYGTWAIIFLSRL